MFGAFEFFNIMARELLITALSSLDRMTRILVVSLFTFVIPSVLVAFFAPWWMGGLTALISLLFTVMILEIVERDIDRSDNKG